MSQNWFTYAEAATVLGIKPDSVKRRAMRKRWPKRMGNDGKARIQMPDAVTNDITSDTTPDITTDKSPPPERDDTRERLAAAETEVRLLREMVRDVTADRDAMRDALARAALDAQTVRHVSIWRRLFGGS